MTFSHQCCLWYDSTCVKILMANTWEEYCTQINPKSASYCVTLINILLSVLWPLKWNKQANKKTPKTGLGDLQVRSHSEQIFQGCNLAHISRYYSLTTVYTVYRFICSSIQTYALHLPTPRLLLMPFPLPGFPHPFFPTCLLHRYVKIIREK